jgi:hypothetical protein
MNSCEHFQTQLLDHLYGLLDEADSHALQDHLVTCAACRTAQEHAEVQRRMLAAAAKQEFAGVRFTPPAAPATMKQPAATLAAPAARRSWVRWALAACLLLALAGLGLAGVKWQEYHHAVTMARIEQEQALDEKNVLVRQQTDAARELREIQEQIRLLEAKWTAEAEQVQRKVKSQELQVIVSGPKTLQPGAPNRYNIQTRDRNNAPKEGKVQVGIVDSASNKELYRRELLSVNGQAQLDLPANLPVKPGTQLALLVTAAGKDGVEAKVTEQLPLIAPLFLTHLTTDRPMYRPGEVVYFRSLTLDRFSLRPTQEDLLLQYRITDPSGAEVFKLEGAAKVVRDGKPIQGPDGKPLRGIGAGEFRIPPASAGGEYTLTVSEGRERFPAEKRKFLVNQYQAPRLNKELEFGRKSYGAGEEVEASCKVARVEGGTPLVNQPVTATVHVDGQPVAVPGTLRTDAQGKVPPVRFKLPAQIARGDGTLAVQFTDGANVETIVRPIPIVVKKLQVEFFPEGGDLVAGVPNRVYFQVRTMLNKPAELTGRLVDPQGNTVTGVQTLNDAAEPGVNHGLGAFEFVPQAGKAYELMIDAPSGIEGTYKLPEVKTDRVVLHTPSGVVTDKIDVVLRSGGYDRRLLVGVYCRGRLLDHASVFAKQGEASLATLKPAASVSGVYRVTVFEERQGADLVPVAERLIYRCAVEQMHLEVKADKAKYSPGDRVKVSLSATNEHQQSAPVILLLKAVDHSIIKLADEKTARSMPTQFYLGTEVRKAEDLEYADFLLSDHPKAAAALDLLLGTQGWRRFAEQDPKQFRRKQQQDAERLLVASGQSSPNVANLAELEVKQVDEKFAPQYVTLQTHLADAERAQGQRAQRNAQEVPRLATKLNASQTALGTATAHLRDFNMTLWRTFVGIVLVVLLLAAVCVLLLSLWRASGERRPMPYLATGFGMLLLLVVAGGAATIYHLGSQQGATTLASLAPRSADQPARAGAPVQDAKDLNGVQNWGRRLGEELEGLPRPAVELGLQFNEALKDQGKKAPKDVLMLGDPGVNFDLLRRQDLAVPEPAGAIRDLDRLDDMAEVQQQAGVRGRPLAAGGRAGGLVGGWEDQLGGQPFGFNGGMLGNGAGLPGGRFKEERGFRGGIGGIGGLGGFQAGFGVQDEAEMVLRRQGQFKQLAQLRMARAVMMPPVTQPLVVREYAHHHQASADNIRRDFAETLYWQPVLVLTNGKGEAAFDLPDSTTTFEVVAWGHTLDGRLGAATSEIVSRLPFSLEPKLPTEVTSTDKIAIPLTVANDTTSKRSVEVHAEATGLQVLGKADRQLAVDADRRVRQIFEFQPALVDGQASVRFRGRCEPFGTDSVERTFKVVPEGFPVVGAQSDMLEGTARQVITLPQSWIKGTLKCQVQVFPSMLADLQKGLEGLLREPGGCFEQTSSSNYPNVLILSYLKESSQSRPDLEERARRLLDSGYRQLTSFECLAAADKRQGYEWFGGSAPPHEALTAYGLLEFRDMSRVHPVDQAMVERTRQYLLAQRDGKGGFKRNPRALDTFGRAPDNITNAYVVWAITEGGTDDKLETELNALFEQAKTSKDPYFLSLVGAALLNRNRGADAVELLKTVAAAQKADGHLEAAQTSITGSGGRDLEIETTAVATLAWLKANRPADFNMNVQKAIKWIGQQRGGYGGFGSTQSTILALKALIAFTRENRKTAEAGDLKLFVNDQPEPVAMAHFAAGTLEQVVATLPREDLLKPGKNNVRIEVTGKNVFPYTLSWSYQTLQPANAENYPVQLTARLDRAQAVEGETVRLTATVANKTGKGQGMAVAIIGLPGGLAVPEDMRQLKDLARLRDNDTKPGIISAFELRGRELVLYWRDLAPDQKIDVNLDLICRIPGTYRGPASRAYLYYNADNKYWIEPLTATIAAKGE